MENKIQKKINVNILTKNEKKVKKVNKLTKAQVSLFIILGLMAFLVVSFIFHVTKSAVEKNMEENTEKLIKESIRTEPITSYISLCLDSSLIQALDLIGKQGGYIYKNQQGSLIPFNIAYIPYKSYNVSYLIEPVLALPPWYPCFNQENFPAYCKFVNNINAFPELYSYVFGTSKLPFLYKNQGSYSVQEQLEHYISVQTKLCANFTGLVTKQGFEHYNITEGNISAEIFFHENDVSVILAYPISIKVQDTLATDLLEFKSTAKIRFLKIYEAVKEIIQKDNNFLDYDIIENTKQGYFNQEELKFINLVPQINIQKQIIDVSSDIIIMQDSLSKINGDNYIFQFARKNRYPVLDYINAIIINKGESFQIDPKAKDPDEYPVSFELKGSVAERLKGTGPYTYDAVISPLSEGYYTFDISASDSQLSDYQIVEIVVCNNYIGQDSKCDRRCGAEDKCHLKKQDDIIPSCTIKPHLKDKCTPSCQLTESSICGLIADGCAVNPNCENSQKFTIKPNGWCYGNGDGCTSFCPEELVNWGNTVNISKGVADQLAVCGCNQNTKGSPCYNPPYNEQTKGVCDINNNCV